MSNAQDVIDEVLRRLDSALGMRKMLRADLARALDWAPKKVTLILGGRQRLTLLEYQQICDVLEVSSAVVWDLSVAEVRGVPKTEDEIRGMRRAFGAFIAGEAS